MEERRKTNCTKWTTASHTRLAEGTTEQTANANFRRNEKSPQFLGIQTWSFTVAHTMLTNSCLLLFFFLIFLFLSVSIFLFYFVRSSLFSPPFRWMVLLRSHLHLPYTPPSLLAFGFAHTINGFYRFFPVGSIMQTNSMFRSKFGYLHNSNTYFDRIYWMTADFIYFRRRKCKQNIWFREAFARNLMLNHFTRTTQRNTTKLFMWYATHNIFHYCPESNACHCLSRTRLAVFFFCRVLFGV